MQLTWDKDTNDIEASGTYWAYLGHHGRTAYYAKATYGNFSSARRVGREKLDGVYRPGAEVRTEDNVRQGYGVRTFRGMDRDHADRQYGTAATAVPEGYVSKEAVEAEARRVARENGWCDAGLQESLGRLGITTEPERYEVVLTVSVTVEGTRDEATRTVKEAAQQAVRSFGTEGRVTVARTTKLG